MPYPIPPSKDGLSPIENMAMIGYLMYKHKHKTNNIKGKRLTKDCFKLSQSHVQLRRGWHKYGMSWLNHWRIEEVTLQKMIPLKILPHDELH